MSYDIHFFKARNGESVDEAYERVCDEAEGGRRSGAGEGGVEGSGYGVLTDARMGRADEFTETLNQLLRI